MYIGETELCELKETKSSDETGSNDLYYPHESEEQSTAELDKTIIEYSRKSLFENVYQSAYNSKFKYDAEKDYNENYKIWFKLRNRSNFSGTYNVPEEVCEILDEMRLSDIKYYFRHELEKRFDENYAGYKKTI